VTLIINYKMKTSKLEALLIDSCIQLPAFEKLCLNTFDDFVNNFFDEPGDSVIHQNAFTHLYTRVSRIVKNKPMVR
jgi:hypothetical protein